MSVTVALAEANHHTAPRGQKIARAEATPDALQSQRTSVAGDTEFFSLCEEELGGTRPDCLAGVRPQARVQRQHRGALSTSHPPRRLFDTVLLEQVIDVPKISQDIIQQRLVDRDLRHTQTAEQLVEVPTILYFLKQCS